MPSDAAIQLIVSLQDNASAGLDNLGQKSNALGNALGFAAGGAIVAGVQALGGAVTGFLQGAIDESSQAADGQAALGAVLESTGGKAGVTRDMANDLASKYQDLTKFTDDQVLSSENMLLTFTNISSDVFPAATETTLNLATAMGTDASGASVMLGKALNDPEQGISALTRVGVTFTEKQKDAIKALQDTGDMAGAQRIILNELGTEFGHAAEAAGTTFSGQLAILGHHLDDAKQAVGDALMPALNSLIGMLNSPGTQAAIQSIIQGLGTFLVGAIGFLQGAFTNLQPALATAFGVISGIAGVIGAVVAGFGSGGLQGAVDALAAKFPALQGPLDFLLGTFRTVSSFISDNLGPILAGLSSGALTYIAITIATVTIPAFVAWATAAGTAALATIAALAPVLIPVAAIGIAVGLLKAAWDNDWGGIRTTLMNWWDGGGRATFEQLRDWLATNIPIAIDKLRQFWENTLLPAIQTVWHFITGTLIPALQTLATNIGTTVGNAVSALTRLWQDTLLPALTRVAVWVQTNLVPLWNAVEHLLSAVVGVAVTALAGIWQNVLQPALQGVWDFISSSLKPVLDDLGGPVTSGVKDGFSAIAAVWNDTLAPAMRAIASFLQQSLAPAFDAVSSAIRTIISFLNDLAGKLDSIHLPDWMTPHSPTPWEVGLLGVGSAMSALSTTHVPALARALGGLPSTTIGVAAAAGLPGPGGGTLAGLAGTTIRDVYISLDGGATYQRATNVQATSRELEFDRAARRAGRRAGRV